jgi:mannose/fructose/N-acetylgalactosamine-specific phosphotransferase system component IIC
MNMTFSESDVFVVIFLASFLISLLISLALSALQAIGIIVTMVIIQNDNKKYRGKSQAEQDRNMR